MKDYDMVGVKNDTVASNSCFSRLATSVHRNKSGTASSIFKRLSSVCTTDPKIVATQSSNKMVSLKKYYNITRISEAHIPLAKSASQSAHRVCPKSKIFRCQSALTPYLLITNMYNHLLLCITRRVHFSQQNRNQMRDYSCKRITR